MERVDIIQPMVLQDFNTEQAYQDLIICLTVYLVSGSHFKYNFNSIKGSCFEEFQRGLVLHHSTFD